MTSSSPGPLIPRVRWGIVGASDIADRVMAPAMRTAASSELVAIVSRSPERAAAFTGRHGPMHRYDSLGDMAANGSFELDAVYVATEVDRHASDVIAAAQAGWDILVEKPIARTAAEGQRMVDACAAAGVRLGTCFYQRYNTRHATMRDLIASGRIGQVTTAQVTFSSRSVAQRGGWRRDPSRSGGGSFIDSASHCVDLLRFLLGDVGLVAAFTDALADGGGPVEDTAFAILRMASGVQASIGAHWSTTDSSEARSSMISVGGTDGTLVSWPLHEKFSRGTLLLATEKGEETIHMPEASTHVALLDDFARARAEGRPFPITGEDGVAAQRVVDAVYASSRTRTLVELS